MSELLACPFCGKADSVYMAGEGTNVLHVVCDRCVVYGPTAHNEEAARKRWNERKSAR